MSQRTKVVGARTPLIWLLIILAIILIAIVAVAALIILPQQQQLMAAQERAAQTEQHYQAGVAFEGVNNWGKAVDEYEATIALNAGYKDAQSRLARVKAMIVDETSTASAVALAQTTEARDATQATATAEAETAATAEAAVVTATAEALQAQYQRALGYINMEKWAEAKTELDSVFAVDPTYEDVQERLVGVEGKLAELGTPTPTPTIVPTALVEPTKTPTTTPVPKGAIPPGNWFVRSYNTDDSGVVFVNEKLVAATTLGSHSDSGWIAINNLLVPGQKNVVSFANWNDVGPRLWGFSLKRNDTAIWGSEESPGSGPEGLSYVQQVSILPDGNVQPIAPDTSVWTPPPGNWYVRVQDVDDVGAILVNSLPVAIEHDRQDSDWVEITGQLRSDRDNILTIAAWNFEDDYSWSFSIKKDDTIVWSKDGTGSDAVEEVVNERVEITAAGNLVLPSISGASTDQTWSVRTHNTDDLGIVFVNDQLVGASIIGSHNDSGWIEINDQLVPGQEDVVSFASWNDVGPRLWGFALKRNDVAIWGSEESPGSGPKELSYVQQVSIQSDGSVQPIAPDTSVWTPPPGKWYVRVQDVDDVGAVLVNGSPVAAAHDGQDSDWVEITNELHSDRDNTVAVTAWNFDAAYKWKFSIKRDDTIVWAVERNGSGVPGLTLSQSVTIKGNGEFVGP